jgi:uncharacterized protein (TIGR00725 family)
VRQIIIGIVGGHFCNTTPGAMQMAEEVGATLARRGMALICGGGDGVMEAACRGCREAGGTTLGVLKGNCSAEGNQHLDYAILTSMDVASNNIIVWTAAGLIAFDGRYGTLNEVALALDFGKPLVMVGRPGLLNVPAVTAENFVHFDGYDLSLVPKIIDRLEAMIRGGSL